MTSREAGAAVPAWARAADACAVLFLGLALFVALAGRGVFLPVAPVVLPPATLLLFAAAAVVVIRHAARPRPGIFATIAAAWVRVESRPHLAAAVRAFIDTRPLVFFVAYLAVVTLGFPRTVGFILSSDPLANLPARFDAGWYGGIALDGYEWDKQFGRQRNIAFFPAQPLLMRTVGVPFGAGNPTLPREKRMVRALWAGVFVSLAAFLWALVYVSRLSERLAGAAAATAAPMLLAAYPFAVYFNAPYTEGLFLLGAAGAFWEFHRGRWIRASLFGLLAGFSRPNGCLLSIPLAMLAIEHAWRARDSRPAAALARETAIRTIVAAMPGVAMLIFTAYLHQLTGVWFAWARMHGAWGRSWGTGALTELGHKLSTDGLLLFFQNDPYNAVNATAALFALALVWPVFRRLGPAYAAFVLVNLIPPLFTAGALSMGRITSTLFPLFIVLATLPARFVPGWVAAFAMLQGLVAALFFTWRDLY